MDSLIQTAPAAIVALDAEMRILIWNPAAERIFGWKKEEVLGGLLPYVPEEERSGSKAIHHSALEGRIVSAQEVRRIRKDGSPVELSVSAGIFRDQNGKVRGTVAIMEDISERKRLDDELDKEKGRFRLLAEKSPLGIALIGPENRYGYFNPKFKELFGYTSEEISTGRDWLERAFPDPDYRAQVRSTWEKDRKETGIDQARARIFKIRCKDALEKWISINSVFLEDDNQIIMYEDVTHYMQAEEDSKRNADLQKVINSLLGLSMEEVPLEAILNKAIDLILAVPWLVLESRGAILLVEKDPQVLVLKAQRGLNRILEEACSRVPFGRCICGRAALKKEIEFADRIDERHDIRYEGMIPHGHYCVPILFSDQILGVINLYVKEGHSRSSKEEEFLMAVSQTLAGIIIRQRTEKSLMESEERYRDLVESSRDLISIHDLKGQILWVNEEPVKILGYKKEDILKMNVRDILALDYRGEFDNYLAALQSQGVARGLMMIQTAQGENRIWEYNNTLRTEGLAEPIVRSMARDVTEQKSAEREVKKTLEKLRKAIGGIIQVISQTVELRDPYTAGHQRRVSELARAIAQEMGLSAEQVDGLRMAGVIHDLGKISVPAEILSKPIRLTDLEFELIKTHARTGYEILKDIDFPWAIARMVLEHHERINGSGYPQGLKGEEILMESRILAVADVVEAIATHRPYRPAHGIEVALEEITKNKGILYDPKVVEACLILFMEKGYKLE